MWLRAMWRHWSCHQRWGKRGNEWRGDYCGVGISNRVGNPVSGGERWMRVTERSQKTWNYYFRLTQNGDFGGALIGSFGSHHFSNYFHARLRLMLSQWTVRRRLADQVFCMRWAWYSHLFVVFWRIMEFVMQLSDITSGHCYGNKL